MVLNRPLIVGLTGSVAMGKTETAQMFRRLRVPVFDADAEVHRILGSGGAAVKRVSASFPGVLRGDAIDRKALGARVFGSKSDLNVLERIVHPLVNEARKNFLCRAGVGRAALVVMDVPLLFETRGSNRYDFVIVVSAPAFVQRQRAMARSNMNKEKLSSILSRQMPDSLKRRNADFVICTGIGKRAARISIIRILRILKGKAFSRQRRESTMVNLARNCP